MGVWYFAVEAYPPAGTGQSPQHCVETALQAMAHMGLVDLWEDCTGPARGGCRGWLGTTVNACLCDLQGNTEALIPWADFLNHSPAVGAHLDWDGKSDALPRRTL